MKALMEVPHLVKGTDEHSRSSRIEADGIIEQVEEDLLCHKEAVELTDLLWTEDAFTTNDRERLVECIGRCHEDEGPTPSTACSSVVRKKKKARREKSRQTNDNIENYLTATIWGAVERGDHVNYDLERVGKLLVDLGIMYPKEKLFASIVALVEL